MNKSKLLKTILASMMVLTMMPMSVKANPEDENRSNEQCYFQGKNGDVVTFECFDKQIPLNPVVRTKAESNIKSISTNSLEVKDGRVTFNVIAKAIDVYTIANYTIELYDGNTLIGSQQLSIPAGEKDEPDYPDEPDTPDTPMGNVFMISEGTKIPTMKVNEETTIKIPVTRNERITKNEAQVSVKLPDGIYFTEIANIQNIEFERKNDYESFVEFHAMANPDVASGVYPITLTVKYKYDGVNHDDTLEFYVKVIGKGEVENDDEVKGKPRIIIDSYSFGGSQVMGGSPFTLAMNFKNTSTNVDIKNLKITVQSAADEDTGGVFTPTASSNSFFVNALNRNTAVNKSIVLMPRADAKPKSYGVDITFEYEAMMNGDLQEFSSTERISIPVVQSDRFEIGEVSTWGDFWLGESSDIMVSYVNKGKTTINNLEITVESEMLDIPEKTTYVGNVESGSSDMFSTSVSALAEGDVTGIVTFKYEDSNGNQVEVVKEFNGTAINPYAGMDPDIDIEPMPEPIEETSSSKVWWIVGIVAIVVLVGVGFYFMKKKKAKKAKEDAAFDDFDEA